MPSCLARLRTHRGFGLSLALASGCLVLALSIISSVARSKSVAAGWFAQVERVRIASFWARKVLGIVDRETNIDWEQRRLELQKAEQALQKSDDAKNPGLDGLLQRTSDWFHHTRLEAREHRLNPEAANGQAKALDLEWQTQLRWDNLCYALALSGPMEQWRNVSLLAVLGTLASVLLLLLRRIYRRETFGRIRVEEALRESETRFGTCSILQEGVLKQPGRQIGCNQAYGVFSLESQQQRQPGGGAACVVQPPGTSHQKARRTGPPNQ